MKKGFTVESILTRSSSLADGGMNIGFHTKELNSTEKVAIMDFHNKTGFLLFSEDAITEEDVPVENTSIQTKTHSMRLRSVLFVLWKQGRSKDTFDSFYSERMEKLIEQIKQKLG